MVNMLVMPLIGVEKTASLTGHRDCIYTLENAGSDHLFFSAGGDGMVAIWDLQNPQDGQLIAKVPNSVYALCYSRDKNQLLIGQNFAGIHLVDVVTRQELFSTAITDSYVFDIARSDGKIFVATGDGSLVVLAEHDLSTIIRKKFSDQSLRALSFSPDGRFLAAGFSDHQVRILDPLTLNDLHVLKDHTNSVFTVTFSPDGKYLLTAGRDAHLKIYETGRSFEQNQSIVAHMYAINHIAYSPDGRCFATCSMDKSVKIWDAESFRLLKVIDKSRHAGHGTSVNKLLWSVYRSLLVSASDDRSISVWDIKFN